jgi:hypothetical protein
MEYDALWAAMMAHVPRHTGVFAVLACSNCSSLRAISHDASKFEAIASDLASAIFRFAVLLSCPLHMAKQLSTYEQEMLLQKIKYQLIGAAPYKI